MTPIACAHCGAPLDTVPDGVPCPSCGGPPGRVTDVVRRALDELAALPDDEAGAVVQQLLRVAGRTEGKTTFSGALAVVHQLAGRVEGKATLSADLTVHEGRALLAGTAELVRATDACAAKLVRPRGTEPWSVRESMRRHPVLWWLLGELAAPHLAKLSEEVVGQLAALVAAGHLDLALPPPSGEPPPPPAVVQPAPQPPACFPPDGSARR